MHKCNEISCFYYASLCRVLCLPFPSPCLLQHKKSQFNFATPPRTRPLCPRLAANSSCSTSARLPACQLSPRAYPTPELPLSYYLPLAMLLLYSPWQLVEHCFQGLPSAFKERLSERSTLLPPRPSSRHSLSFTWLLIKTSSCVYVPLYVVFIVIYMESACRNVLLGIFSFSYEI